MGVSGAVAVIAVADVSGVVAVTDVVGVKDSVAVRVGAASNVGVAIGVGWAAGVGVACTRKVSVLALMNGSTLVPAIFTYQVESDEITG